ncbi:MAG: hypothetical protein NUW37_12680 [Planctomycetes bacterium]|nr:hypothetical protein [Planctomycetota bacterium]
MRLNKFLSLVSISLFLAVSSCQIQIGEERETYRGIELSEMPRLGKSHMHKGMVDYYAGEFDFAKHRGGFD